MLRENDPGALVYSASDTMRKKAIVLAADELVAIIVARYTFSFFLFVAVDRALDLTASRAGTGAGPDEGRNAGTEAECQFQAVFLFHNESVLDRYADQRYSIPSLRVLGKPSVNMSLLRHAGTFAGVDCLKGMASLCLARRSRT